MNVLKNKVFFTLIIAALLGIGLSATAQTCRVRSGRASNGGSAYMEVFEYDYVSDKPSFPGGDVELVEFINKTRQYPADAYRKGVQGRVTCAFVVNTDGSVSHISVLRGVDPLLNQEAIRIFSKMPDWTPGKHEGHVVPVRVIWSVPFRK